MFGFGTAEALQIHGRSIIYHPEIGSEPQPRPQPALQPEIGSEPQPRPQSALQPEPPCIDELMD